ncbi:hypothetical protein Leryth_001880 [Lithospermum erythrorhizon]|nr:hypothetical protein Leryth_001880 [Lithospermum erythrorhizon]
MRMAISGFGKKSKCLFVFTPQKGNLNPFIILSFGFHNSTNRSYAFEDIKNLDDAVSLFHQMLQMKPIPSNRDYNKLFSIIVKMKHYSQVIILFKKMRPLGSPVNSKHIMNTVINCYCNLKEVDMGFAVLASMLKLGFAPDIVTINCLIKGLFFQQNVAKAVELLKKLIRDKLCKVDEFTIPIVLDGLAKSGNIVQALQLLDALEKEKYRLNATVYNTIINGLCKGLMLDDAMTLFSKMIEKGILPNVITYSTLIHAFCTVSRWDEAKKLLTQMVSYKIYPNKHTFSILVDAFCKNGLIEDAKDVVKLMEEWSVKPDVVTYNALMDGYCLQGQLDEAKNLLNFMADKGMKPNLFSYGTMINGYCKHKKIDHAWKMFEA